MKKLLVGLLVIGSISSFAYALGDVVSYKTSANNCTEGYIKGKLNDRGGNYPVLTCLREDSIGRKYKTSSNKCIEGYIERKMNDRGGNYPVLTCLKL